MKKRKSDVSFTVSDDGRLTAHDKGSKMRRVKDVAIPEGVVVIGERVMENFRCHKLTMPSTLKVIEKYAFKGASIYDIDFGDCKLERIEDGAFSECAAVAELPDTVEYIGNKCSLTLAKEQKLKLPKSLKHVGNSAIYLGDVSEVELQESMISEDSNISRWLYACVPYKHWVTFRVFRDGVELYRFVHDGNWRTDVREYNYIEFQELLYECYDDLFDSSSSMLSKVHMAAYRLVWSKDMPSYVERKYKVYVRDNFLRLIDGKENDIEFIRLLSGAGLITALRYNQLLERATQTENVELAALLLADINKKGGPKSKSLKL
ncbi:MAG: leucine-rich repeat domain-containing protein [Clostridiales bacterium]|jgi:hypothetical protein|nr:leucine-rich repeat domain-containing protein [Clostridiales bacterium]